MIKNKRERNYDAFQEILKIINKIKIQDSFIGEYLEKNIHFDRSKNLVVYEGKLVNEILEKINLE